MSFQAESTLSGIKFENIVASDLLLKGFDNLDRNVYIEEAGIEIDYVYQNIYIEAKGGEEGEGKRPGAKRTDSVKKAIANGALLKQIYPDSIYIVYFSSEPVPNSSSDNMLKLAIKSGFIDEIRYL